MKRYAFFYCYAFEVRGNTKTLENVTIVAVHIASTWPWFSVNELLYIFVILYKRGQNVS